MLVIHLKIWAWIVQTCQNLSNFPYQTSNNIKTLVFSRLSWLLVYMGCDTDLDMFNAIMSYQWINLKYSMYNEHILYRRNKLSDFPNYQIILQFLFQIRIRHQTKFQKFDYCPINCTMKFTLKYMGIFK